MNATRFKSGVSRSPLPGYDFMLSSLDWSNVKNRKGTYNVPMVLSFVRLRWWHRVLSLPLVIACIRKAASS